MATTAMPNIEGRSAGHEVLAADVLAPIAAVLGATAVPGPRTTAALPTSVTAR